MDESIDWNLAFQKPDYFAQKVLGVKLHAGQTKWLENSHTNENMLVTGNRWGKSYVSAVKILYRAIFRIRDLKFDLRKKYRIVTASITQDQANIVFQQAVSLARESKILEPLLLTITKTPFPKMVFSNGAAIEARSTQNRGEYLLGNDYDYFIFDEVAFETEPEYVVEEVIRMRLADREGMLDLISTPNGKNWFYRRMLEISQKKRKGYFQSGDTRENSFISKDAVDDRIETFSDRRIQQNIMGQFVDSGGEIIRGVHVDRALQEYSERTDEFALESTPYYISGWDLARKKTATVGITVQVKDGKALIISVERFKLYEWKDIIQKIKERQKKYPGRLFVDATGLGDVVVEQLKDYNPTPVIFTESVKAELLTNVEFFHEQNKIWYERWELPDGVGKIWAFEDEMRQARWDKNNECDSLMALALALWPLYRKSKLSVAPRIGRI